ncbi:MAG: type IV pilus twitching motility protein PilT [Myxococcota bacterium]
MSTPEDALLGKIAVHYKLVTNEQLLAASQRQAGAGGKPIGDVMLELKLISAEQLKWLKQAQQQYLAKQGGGAAPAPSSPRPAAAASAPAPSSPRPVAAASAPAPAAIPPPAASPIGPPAAAPLSTPSGFHQVQKAQTDFSGAKAQAMRSKLPTLAAILSKAVEAKASDVHIHAGAPLAMRICGVLRELRTGVLSADDVEFILKDALSEEERNQLNEDMDFDTALVMPKVGRFRSSFYKQQRGWDAVFRPIPPEPPTLEELGLPPTLKKLADYHQGLVLLTGPAGCGKSSTMAALVRMLNESRNDHIITVEDPIEYVHTQKGCVVNQRQAGKHTRSFANALRAALREDPDIIIIGELRDLETISLAITAAETGHLVIGTLHTNNAIRTINRVLDVFPPKQQSQIRSMVSESLRAIVSQRLVPTADGSRRVPAAEVLFVKPSVSNLIREEKTFQIRSVMQTGRSEGMVLLDESLQDLVKAGTITKAAARAVAEDPKRFA